MFFSVSRLALGRSSVACRRGFGARPLSATPPLQAGRPRAHQAGAAVAPSTESRKGLHLRASGRLLPHPEKARSGGEDAVALHRHLLVVADGVGGWSSQGVDPGKYSKEFVLQMVTHAAASPKALDADALAAVVDECQELVRLAGSTTLAMAAVDCDRDMLTLGHLGDAGYMLLRRGGCTRACLCGRER